MDNSRGNALFLILIAVALFAALSYAVTQSGRGGGSIDKEQSVLNAAQITQYGASLQQAATRMLLTGTTTATLALDTAWASGVPCSSGEDCIFDSTGGGVAWRDPAALGASNNISFWRNGDGAKISGVGTATEDIYMIMWNISENICTAINRGLGLSLPTQSDSIDIDLIIDAYPGEYAACFETAAGGTYRYYHVLVAQ